MSSPAPEYTEQGDDWLNVEHAQKQKPDVSEVGSSMASPLSVPLSLPLSFHPDIRTPGLETAWGDDQGKEVVPPDHNDPEYLKNKYPLAPYDQDGGTVRPKRRICGIPLALFLLLLAFIVVLAIGLGVGLGVGLGRKHNSNGVQNKYLSKAGAFNGSGIAIASYSFGSGGYGVINVYFQHWTGQIRKIQLMDDGAWEGGDETNIVATDAKNATPISAVAYAMDDVSTWHIFYIDTNNIIREKVNDNTTNEWTDGPIGDLNLVAMDDDAVGLQACWYGSFYGTANYVHSPIPSTGTNTTSQDAVIGMHLWYGVNPTTVSEVTWTYNTTDWYPEGNLTANGHAGIGCYSWGPGSVTYLMMVNLDNTLQMQWKDLNATAPSSPNHPLNQWVNSSVTIPGVMPNTSLGYTNYLYTQLADGSIGGFNISFAAENSTILASQDFDVPETPLPGTHFSVTAIPNSSGGNSLLVFDQINGSDITENTRDLSNGQWSYASLPIPNS